MKLRLISYIIVIVFGLAILVVGEIAMINHHLPSEKWYIPASGFFLILAGGFGIYMYHRIRTVEKATAQTMGIICGSWGGGEDGDHCWFKVRFTVDGKEYRIRETTSIDDALELKKHINHKVPVHYDPNHPRTAWAECPGSYRRKAE